MVESQAFGNAVVFGGEMGGDIERGLGVDADMDSVPEFGGETELGESSLTSSTLVFATNWPYT